MIFEQVLRRRLDGTFVGLVNGYEYHIIESDPLFADAAIAGADAPLEIPPALPTLEELREGTTMPKYDFLTGVTARGWITHAEQLQAARGLWPDSLAPALVGLSEADALAVQIEWAQSSNIARINPTVLAMAAFKGITATELDDLFGIQA